MKLKSMGGIFITYPRWNHHTQHSGMNQCVWETLLKGYSTNSTCQSQFSSHGEYNTACENSFIMYSVVVEGALSSLGNLK